MAIGMGDSAAMLLLTGFGALAWRRRNVGGKTWAFRVIPFGIMLMALVRDYGPGGTGFAGVCRSVCPVFGGVHGMRFLWCANPTKQGER